MAAEAPRVGGRDATIAGRVLAVFLLAVLFLAAAGVLLVTVDWAAPTTGSGDTEPSGAPIASSAPADVLTASGPVATTDADARRIVPLPAPSTGTQPRVRVVDASGHPLAGVTVCFAATPPSPALRSFDAPCRVRTDAEGQAAPWGAVAGGDACFAWPRVPVAQRVVARVPLTDHPEAPVEIRIPAGAVIEVQVEAADAPWFEGAEVALAELRTTELGTMQPQETWHAALRGGLARFEHVGLGMHFRVRCESAVGELTATVDVAGPRRVGEVCSVKLAPPADRALLSMVVTDPDGQPLTDATLRAWTRPAGPRDEERENVPTLVHAHVETDDRGRCFVQVETEGTGPRTLVLGCTEPVDLHGTRALGALAPGVHELGTLTLSATRPLATGRIVDEAGSPIAGAEVRTVGLEFATRSDAEGAFEVRPGAAVQTLDVRVRKRGFAERSLTLHAGGDDLEITLSRLATVTGSLLLDPHVTRAELDYRFVHTEGDSSVGWRALEPRASVQPTFELPVPPGIATLAFRLRHPPTVLVTTAPLRLLSRTTLDLGAIDARRGLHRIEFRIVGPSGAEMPRAQFALLDFEHVDAVSHVDRGAGHVFAPGTSVDLVVFGNGLRTTTAHGVEDGTEIVVLPGFEVALRLPPSLELPPKCRLRVRVSSAAPSTRRAPWRHDSTTTLSSGQRHTRIVLPEPGSYVVTATVRPLGQSRDVQVGAPSTLQVSEPETVTECIVPVTRAALATALRTSR